MVQAEKVDADKSIAHDMLDFINASPTPFHAVGEACLSYSHQAS